MDNQKGWQLAVEFGTYTYYDQDGLELYELDISVCDAPQLLDHILHLPEKNWATPEIIGELIMKILDDTPGIAGELCPHGRNRKASKPFSWRMCYEKAKKEKQEALNVSQVR